MVTGEKSNKDFIYFAKSGQIIISFDWEYISSSLECTIETEIAILAVSKKTPCS